MGRKWGLTHIVSTLNAVASFPLVNDCFLFPANMHLPFSLLRHMFPRCGGQRGNY